MKFIVVLGLILAITSATPTPSVDQDDKVEVIILWYFLMFRLIRVLLFALLM
jgi:hypothetical protein